MLDLLARLVSIDSVNPSLVPAGAGEERIAREVASELSAAGLSVSVEEVAPGRPNVVGTLEGRASGRTLVLCGHLDTVGVEGMAAPFAPVQEGGRLSGRGSQDMKGGLAAIVDAARAIAATGGLARGRLLVAAVADEEHASLGAEAFSGRHRADGAIVAEPTDLEIAIAHKGFSWAEVETIGRAAHGSRPEEGRDAILMMGRVLARLEERAAQLRAGTPHPLLGTGSLHASLIEGGRELSSYPDRCRLSFERRTLVGEPRETALAESEQILAEIRSEDPEFRARARFLFGRPAYETPRDCPLPSMIESSLVLLGRAPRRAAATFWTDAAILGSAGIPSVVFGPGGAGLHGLDEYVRTDEVLVCRDVLVDVTRRFCEEG